MGMSLGFLTGYVLGQQGRQSARMAASSAVSSENNVEDMLDLHERIDRLTLAMEAMWSLLEADGYTAEQLKARIDEIDGSDGAVDGRRTPTVAQCARCGAKVAAGLPACQFCGTEVPGSADNPFASL